MSVTTYLWQEGNNEPTDVRHIKSHTSFLWYEWYNGQTHTFTIDKDMAPAMNDYVRWGSKKYLRNVGGRRK